MTSGEHQMSRMQTAADMLREAARLMRERAEAATDGGPRWETGPDEMHGPSQMIVYPADSDSAVAFAGADDAEHIASWHPAVALAVADLLENLAIGLDPRCKVPTEASDASCALAVAGAYLGSTS